MKADLTNVWNPVIRARVAGGAAGLLLAAGLVLTPQAEAQSVSAPQVAISPAWQSWGGSIDYQMGGAGCQRTPATDLCSNLNLAVYKAPPTNDGLDWYLAAGEFIQSVNSGSPWNGVAIDMDILGLTVAGPGAALYDAQPTTTTLTSTSTVDIGGSLGISGSGLTPGIGLSYSSSVDAPSTIVGTTKAGSEANFHFSYSTNSSLQVPVMTIFSVPHGQGLFLQLTPDSWWSYNNQTQNQYRQGTFLADFGAAPVTDGQGNVVQAATGPHIMSVAQQQCMTAGGLGEAVRLQPCDPNNRNQSWYYGQNSQVINAATKACLDFQGGANGSLPVNGSALITDACSTGIPDGSSTPETISSQKWQIETTATSGIFLNVVGQNGYVVNAGTSGALTLAAAGSQNTAFSVQ